MIFLPPSSPNRNGRRLCWPFFVLLLAAGVGLLRAGDNDDRPASPLFVVHTADGIDLRGPLRKLGPSWSVALGGDEETRVEGDVLISLRRAGRALPTLPADRHLILANGDRIPVTSSPQLKGERLLFCHPDLEGGKEVALPLAAVSVYWAAPPERTPSPEKLRQSLRLQTRTSDVILLRNGDTVEGLLVGMDEKQVEIESNKKTTSVPVSQVAALALGADSGGLRTRGPFARLTLAAGERSPGGRISLASATSNGITLEGKTLFGAALKAPLERVIALDVYQGRADYLSDLKTGKLEFTPYFDASWPVVRDANVKGYDLRLASSTYDKGLGLHSKSRLTYPLNGAYRRFEALVGLDDAHGREGSVRVRVLADGKPLDLDGDRELTAKTGPLRVGVKVEGARTLTLEVDFGRNGDVQDVVNWVEARVIK